VSENRALRRIAAPKRDKVITGWRKPHNYFYFFVKYNYEYNDEVKENEMGKECNTHGEKRNVYRISVGKPE
jgi:hypothetical protein